jgi:fructoselysine transporter
LEIPAVSDTHEPKLERALSLTQATVINMIDMVGIGPFVTISFIVGVMQGPMSLLAWALGALLAYMDGFVWAELGAKWPDAGGSYIFLQKLFGAKGGRLMAFLYVWQTVIQAPLVIASGSIGFALYFNYLVPLSELQGKMVSGGLVLLVVALLYRGIRNIGKISVVMWVITGGTILWLIFSGLSRADFSKALDLHLGSVSVNMLMFVALGQASQKAIYSYLGYYNVCHLGAEIKDPTKNIPRSIFISITGIAILYLGMQTVILGVLPWEQVAKSSFVVSDYFEQLYNPSIAKIATMLVLCIALASLFSVLLGYSRVPYAAAKNGDFFAIFAKVHPKHKIPHVSLLALGGLAFVFSLLFKMKDVISAIIIMRILIQFISQAVGVIAWRIQKPADDRPYKMPLFPLPAIISILIWLFIFFSSEWQFILFALGIIATGVVLFYVKERVNRGKLQT